MFKFVILILLVAAVSGNYLWQFWDEGGSGGATPTPRDDAELKRIIQRLEEHFEHSLSNWKVIFFN